MASRTSASAAREVCFHVLHLLLGALGIAVHQLARQFRLERDERKCVAKHVVHVARDALALGNFGEVLDFVVGESQLLLGTMS